MFKFIHCWLTLLKSVSWIASPLSVDYPLNHFSGFFYISLTHSSWVTEEFLTFLSLPLGVYWGTAKQFNLSPREEITKNWSQFRAVILDLFYMIFLRIKWKPWNVSHTNKSHSSACAHLQLHAKFLRFSKSLNRIRRPVLESLRGNYRSCWRGGGRTQDRREQWCLWLLRFSFRRLRSHSLWKNGNILQHYQRIFMFFLSVKSLMK